jgi:Leucine-rich repeat (LRR) protein
MNNLNVLDLENNEIEFLPNDTFNDLKNLVYLKLNGNKLTELSQPILSHLHKLHTFTAFKNKITRIDAEFFAHNENLRWIYLAGNSIDNLEVDFTQIKYLRAVDLRKNAGKCNFLFNVNFKPNMTLEIFQSNVTQYCRKLEELN